MYRYRVNGDPETARDRIPRAGLFMVERTVGEVEGDARPIATYVRELDDETVRACDMERIPR